MKEGWEEYWDYVLKVYDLISLKESKDMDIIEPTYEEISAIIDNLDKSKAVHGSMSIELVKMSGEKVRMAIFRCIMICHKNQDLPDDLK